MLSHTMLVTTCFCNARERTVCCSNHISITVKSIDAELHGRKSHIDWRSFAIIATVQAAWCLGGRAAGFEILGIQWLVSEMCSSAQATTSAKSC